MQQQENLERRVALRRRALMSGTLRFRTRTGTLSCVVRNISTTGARLVVSGSMWVPESFVLEIQHQDIRIDARPVWRGVTDMGIVFAARQDDQDPQPDAGNSANTPIRASAEEKVRYLEAERELLKQRVRQLSEEF